MAFLKLAVSDHTYPEVLWAWIAFQSS